jgi:hypothetical protein
MRADVARYDVAPLPSEKSGAQVVVGLCPIPNRRESPAVWGAGSWREVDLMADPIGTEVDGEGTTAKQMAPRAYHSPALVDYGEVCGLTQAGPFGPVS